MLELRMTRTGSWLDIRSARAMSKKLGEKLWSRCKGHRGLFVTLTYRRDEYRDALDLYRVQSEQQHVPLFLRKIARHLGRNLKGKWFCKMEFQEGGWVHWHLIILDVHKIPHDIATELWGHGHVWLRRLNKKNVQYVTKYAVKSGEVPAWLYAERPRSVKIIRVSPGFWGEPVRPPKKKEPREEEDPYDFWGPSEQRIGGMYVPIGTKIDNNADKFVVRDEQGRYASGQCDLGSLLVSLLEQGAGVVGTRSGWLVLDASWKQLERAERKAEASRASARGASPLHLIRGSNRDAKHRQWTWLDEWIRQDCEMCIA